MAGSDQGGRKLNYIIIFAQAFEEFRIPELESLDKLFNLGIDFSNLQIDIYCPYMILKLDGDDQARQLGSRAISIKHILRHWANATSYEELHQMNRQNRHLWDMHVTCHSFKITITSYKSTISQDKKQSLIQSLSYMDFKGPIDLIKPDVEIFLSEEFHNQELTQSAGSERVRSTKNLSLKMIWLGHKICDGQRSLIDRFDLKKRVYIGNTSMDAGLSLLMANQGLVSADSFVNDPFTGTGSILYACAWFGAQVFGSDIDGRPMRGRDGFSIRDSAKQYGVYEKFIDCQNPWRVEQIFDAIICDLRAGAKKLGRKDLSKLRSEPYVLQDGTYSHQFKKSDYIPPSKPWEMSEVLDELLKFSHRMLKIGGRLVYWLPTVTEDYSGSDIPLLDGMRVVSNSCQDFGKWQRRLITMERVMESKEEKQGSESEKTSTLTGHHGFRDRYMTGFS
ncbi:hypothetical protein PPACK8108_LOCUS12536 [Phakopsora pachyrhizi]|uniref:tRNA (guanine(10)-N(2))-methyltransferase TRMT11 N-terminal domain-containing protein n=1 Tax=Phakopsora pachyrhizi TaxID=170000 RepID=A0AAV0B4A0_PHAPC|nr:hypothetical protein PPACK8108_LOCUS12536 [Phakopsora pachyrhizi]